MLTGFFSKVMVKPNGMFNMWIFVTVRKDSLKLATLFTIIYYVDNTALYRRRAVSAWLSVLLVILDREVWRIAVPNCELKLSDLFNADNGDGSV